MRIARSDGGCMDGEDCGVDVNTCCTWMIGACEVLEGNYSITTEAVTIQVFSDKRYGYPQKQRKNHTKEISTVDRRRVVSRYPKPNARKQIQHRPKSKTHPCAMQKTLLYHITPTQVHD